jgi:predicted dehydrogenase
MTCEELQLQPRKRYQPYTPIGNRSRALSNGPDTGQDEPMTTDSTDSTDADVPIRWGILGTGGIAAMFASDLGLLPDAELVAVGSRSQDSADAFGQRFGIARCYPTYADLVADPDVDAVYVASPHPMHVGDSLLAIEAGKAVLCEKPFTVNAAEARRVVDAATERGTFLMEAMWTRWLPHMVRIRSLIAEGALGQIRAVYADHGQQFVFDPTSRGFAPELGGGALLDLGVYPIALASMLLGTPSAVLAISEPTTTGVDMQTSMLLRHPDGAQAVLTCTMEAASSVTAEIVGTKARIEIDRTWYAPTTFRLITTAGEVTEYDEPSEGRGMQHEAAELGRCLRAGLLESPDLPLAESVAIMTTMDEVRAQIGLRYPGE